MKVCVHILCIIACLLSGIPAAHAQSKALVKAEHKLTDLYTGIYEDASRLRTPRQKRVFLDSLEPVLEKRLISVLDMAGAMDYPFANLKKKMRLTESPDKRLRLFSWNTGLGDTMNFIQIVAQYRDETGAPYIKLLKPISKENKFDQAVDYWEIDALSDSSFLVFGDGKYSTHERAISVTCFSISGSTLIDTAAIFDTEAGYQRAVMIRYSIQVCDPDEINVTYDPDTRMLCYPVMMMIAKDKNIGWCASAENICLLYDEGIFRRRSEIK